MERYYYIGLDIRKKIIAYCVKAIDGSLIDQGTIAADRQSLEAWERRGVRDEGSSLRLAYV
ncbi:MAG: hypothetical protein JRC53_00105 [Deltaproteobacteria bacterium]|nr:hypothetical protein [Deltaproteobacteria bacterium]